VREERVVLLHEGIRRERDRGDLEPPGRAHWFSVWIVARGPARTRGRGCREIRRERPVHDSVVGIRTVSDADPQARTLAPLSRLAVEEPALQRGELLRVNGRTSDGGRPPRARNVVLERSFARSSASPSS
jgi:hypothetical protein